MMTAAVRVYLESGTKRTFAGALEWPGWCRSGKDELSALRALLDYGPRYADVLRGSRVPFSAPQALESLLVVERLKGGSGTDYGAPEAHPAGDDRSMDATELKRSEVLLKACWRRLDAAALAATGKKLRTGPRGGGRTLQKMVDHVVEAEAAYIGALGWWRFSGQTQPDASRVELLREAALKGIAASAAGEIPALGPRGGRRWSPRYFVRRAAWHVLDHAWEIEDRLA